MSEALPTDRYYLCKQLFSEVLKNSICKVYGNKSTDGGDSTVYNNILEELTTVLDIFDSVNLWGFLSNAGYTSFTEKVSATDITTGTYYNLIVHYKLLLNMSGVTDFMLGDITKSYDPLNKADIISKDLRAQFIPVVGVNLNHNANSNDLAILGVNMLIKLFTRYGKDIIVGLLNKQPIPGDK